MFSNNALTIFSLTSLFASLTLAAVPQGVNPYTLPPNPLTLRLRDGQVIDQEGRTGYIASNHQFQFDDPPQAGYLTDREFGACEVDGREVLTLNGSTQFWRCASSNFYNLYDESIADYCEPINIEIRKDGTGNGFVNPTPEEARFDNVSIESTPRGGKSARGAVYEGQQAPNSPGGDNGAVNPRKDAMTGSNESVDSGSGAPYHSRLFSDRS